MQATPAPFGVIVFRFFTGGDVTNGATKMMGCYDSPSYGALSPNVRGEETGYAFTCNAETTDPES